MRIAATFCWLLFGIFASPAFAQPTPTPTPAAETGPAPADDELPPLPPPPPSYPATDSAEPQPAPEAACVPACRTGYACVRGACVPACNPPCASGEKCMANGECSAGDTGAPPPKYFGGSDAPWVDAPKKGVEQHDGFMLRLTLGFGGGSATSKTKLPASVSGGLGGLSGLVEGDIGYSGGAGSFSLDIGAALTDELVLHARLSDMVIVDPKVSLDGQDLGTAEDRSVGAMFIGPALTYYIMPVNIYFTGAVGLSWTNIRQQDSDGDRMSMASDVGLGLNLDIGKEWWVSDNWGLGVAARLWYTVLTHKEDLGIGSTGDTVSTDFKLGAIAVLFSATYQ